ncbi:PAS domain-containing sensor histidine kinase [Cohaesibacter intestini]|uniref:PAS domain-containing sensor histidine kinase n=1 Tax=Cohaesibacter intestini TaxID=2211145 RepID=UPI000DE85103|nr:PAS domain-containing sensor histidine kinase [Cohaesibacter intestini]
MQDAFWANTPIQSVVDGLLHASGKESDSEKARHRVFIAVHLCVGVAALAFLPLVILLSGQLDPTLSTTLSLVPLWMLAPLVSVAYLSKTGKLGNAFLLTATLTATFIGWIAAMTGGLYSPHLIWLGVIPLEVALAGNSRIIKQALLICFAAIACLFGVQEGQLLSTLQITSSAQSFIGSMSIILAILYAGLLAVRIEHLHRFRVSSLSAKELHYRSLANTVSDMITRHDRSGDVTYASDASFSLLGMPPEALSGNNLFHQVHIPDRPAYLRALSDCMNQPADCNDPVTVELQVMRKVDPANAKEESAAAPSLLWVEMKCSPKRDDTGYIVGVIAVSRDISQRKKNQFAMEEARAEAEKANEGKIRFLANVTHELRTPLNTIIGFSEILCHPELSCDNEERNREYAELIHKGGNHLLQLVNSLLDMSRLESGNFEVNAQAFDLNDLVIGCSRMMQAEANRRGITLYSQCGNDLPDVNLDPRACRQIVLNLLSNALKFSDKGDQVCISVGRVRPSVKDNMTATELLMIKVSDTGIGIDKKDLPNVAQPFVQAESSLQRRFEGAGIGLSITRGLAELQHGSFHIKSDLGKGTTVTITLPVDMEKDTVKEATNSVATLKEHVGDGGEKAVAHNGTVSISGKKIA